MILFNFSSSKAFAENLHREIKQLNLEGNVTSMETYDPEDNLVEDVSAYVFLIYNTGQK